MLLDSLRNFSWYNEPENVRFNEEGMVVTVRGGTDFWQSSHHNFHKDDGHFFYTAVTGDFTLTLKWHADAAAVFSQCGIMLRIDNLNWAKAGILSPNLQRPQIGSIVTNQGYSDWASQALVQYQPQIWYRLRRRNGDFIFYYSLDGEVFQQLRMFHPLNTIGEIKAGAYACSPQQSNFSCILESVELD